MKTICALFILVFVVACSSSDGGSKATTFQKNPCVTAGATYLLHYEEVSGTCGPVEDYVISIPADGQIEIGSCNHGPEYQGCTVLLSNVTCEEYDPSIGTYTRKESGKMEWAADGSSGSGLETISLSAAGYEPCTSTYSITATRL